MDCGTSGLQLKSDYNPLRTCGAPCLNPSHLVITKPLWSPFILAVARPGHLQLGLSLFQHSFQVLKTTFQCSALVYQLRGPEAETAKHRDCKGAKQGRHKCLNPTKLCRPGQVWLCLDRDLRYQHTINYVSQQEITSFVNNTRKYQHRQMGKKRHIDKLAC